MWTWFSSALVILVTATWTHSAVLCVNPAGTGGCSTTLQQAVDASSKNDEIEVQAGVYGDPTVIPERARLAIRGVGVADSVLAGPVTIGEKARVTLSELSVRDAPQDCVHVEAKARVEILDALIHGCGEEGVFGDDKVRLTIERSTIRDCGTDGVQAARVTIIRDSTLSANGGYGAHAQTKLLMENSTVSGNVTGGVRLIPFPKARAKVYGSTIAGNGTGLDVGPDTTVLLANVLIADNTVDCDQSPNPPFKTKLVSKGYNLIEDLGTCAPTGKTADDVVGVDPMLSPLAENGGPTATHALGVASPAIDTGNPKPPGGGTKCRPEDQRGVARVGACDIGAYEFP